jgi:hypothetical protein
MKEMSTKELYEFLVGIKNCQSLFNLAIMQGSTIQHQIVVHNFLYHQFEKGKKEFFEREDNITYDKAIFSAEGIQGA